MQQQHKNSFVGGFALGLVAGAAGFFLFATSEGKKVRQKANQAWQEASSELQAQGLIDDPQTTIHDFLQKMFSDGFARQAGKVSKNSGRSKKIQSKIGSAKIVKKSAKKKSVPKRLKFKGV